MRAHEFASVIAVLSAAAALDCPERCCQTYQARTFFGYDCAGNCMRHKAGFAWAERHGIATPAVCPGIDPAFLAGCSAYATEGLASFEAGYAWALENEIAEPLSCAGAGVGFQDGCRQYVDESPGPTQARCAEAWRGHAEALPARTGGR